ncbi:hypothetical protein [Sphingomonas sp. SORGH_AS_0438]|nr:hypothetical protein [Sphingomonas sp. SORGH_AS_0438]MDR6125492.1 hypothetical protein [Sphingomonas sp. SORGH_AS_0438]
MMTAPTGTSPAWAAAAAAASAWRIGSGKGIMPPPAPPVGRA